MILSRSSPGFQFLTAALLCAAPLTPAQSFGAAGEGAAPIPVAAPIPMPAPAPTVAQLSFNRDLRPILSDKCFACHGFDPKKREGGLRLDIPEGAFAKNKDGEAGIVPGNPEASLVWQRITTTDKDDVMPPPESHKSLKPEEREIIRQWILQGAPYQKHWAFEAPLKPATPEGGIDGFVAAGLLKHPALQATGEASGAALIRRVSLTLTGLPPSLEEQDAFLNDASPDAYERMVDRYLASPHYGEEMARHWLDVARYSDTHGMHLDNERQMWVYRDWVVRSFNSNQSFDRFTIEQLAGDLIPDATQDQLIATGFNRCNVTTGEGGAIPEEYLFRYAVDRASTTAQTWLGLTAGCAVCHDHKYDPVTQKEFYQLYAFFYSNADPALDGNAMDTAPSIKVKPADYRTKLDGFEKRAAGLRQDLESKTAAVAYQDPADAAAKPDTEPVEMVWFDDGFPEGAKVNEGGKAPKLAEAPDPVFSGKRSLKRSGKGTTQDAFHGGAATLPVPAEARIQMMVYLDPANPPEELMLQFNTDGWEHRAFWGADVIAFGQADTPSRFAAGPLPDKGQWVKLELEADKLGLKAGDQVSGYAFTANGGTVWFDRLAVSGKLSAADDPARSFAAWRKAAAGTKLPGLADDLAALLTAGSSPGSADPDKSGKTAGQLSGLRNFYLQRVCSATAPGFAGDLAGIDAVASERKAYEDSLPVTLIWNDLAKPRDTFVMERGQYNKPGAPVEPGTPAVLPALHKSAAQGRATRMDLAKWLVAPENPLTARVTVNRFWQQVFGFGLVKTGHDFGTQGALPSNAPLMDWLAVEFEQSGWDVKKLMRRMLVSQAFRRAAAAPENQWVEDPDNTFFARGPRLRLGAEQLRDQALFVSGLLDFTAGGRGTQPYQPPNIWEPVGYLRSNTRNYKVDTGINLHRRSLYTFLKRTAPPPFMGNFDAPSRELTCTARERSNTPLQALQLMNDIQHVEAARAFAGRILDSASAPAVAVAAAGAGATEGAENGGESRKADTDRVTFAWRAALSRPPEAWETEEALTFYLSNLAIYRANPEEAKKLITLGDSKPDPKQDPAELAAWTLTANMILNLDESINRN